MNILDNPIEGFAPELYIATLSKLAHVDGLHDSEQEILDHQAERFGIDLTNLPDVPEDLTELPWATRVLVYRDAVMLAIADEETSDEERRYLVDLARRMKLPSETIDAIEAWVREYGALLERLDEIVEPPG